MGYSLVEMAFLVEQGMEGFWTGGDKSQVDVGPEHQGADLKFGFVSPKLDNSARAFETIFSPSRPKDSFN